MVALGEVELGGLGGSWNGEGWLGSSVCDVGVIAGLLTAAVPLSMVTHISQSTTAPPSITVRCAPPSHLSSTCSLFVRCTSAFLP